VCVCVCVCVCLSASARRHLHLPVSSVRVPVVLCPPLQNSDPRLPPSVLSLVSITEISLVISLDQSIVTLARVAVALAPVIQYEDNAHQHCPGRRPRRFGLQCPVQVPDRPGPDLLPTVRSARVDRPARGQRPLEAAQHPARQLRRPPRRRERQGRHAPHLQGRRRDLPGGGSVHPRGEPDECKSSPRVESRRGGSAAIRKTGRRRHDHTAYHACS